MRKPEQFLTTRVANFLKMTYPNQPFRFDIGADVPLAMVHAKRSKELHGKWNRGYPDLFICRVRKKKGGLYLELKATPEVPNSDHTRRQAAYHEILRQCGYKVSFCCGFGDCIKKINKYLS